MIRPLTLLYFINLLSISWLTSVLLTFKTEVTINKVKLTKLEYLDELGKEPGVINQSCNDYILNPGFNICGEDYGRKVKILAMILTSPENYDRRFILRNTWGYKTVYPEQLKILFLLGKSKNQTVNSNIKNEFAAFGDILQADFADTYKNLTIKTLMGMKWAAALCEQATFLLKIDDDMSFNVYRVMKYLDHLKKSSGILKKTMICKLNRNATVVRNLTNKFYVSPETYPHDVYPIYCDGPAYLLTADLARMFYIRSLYAKMYVFEDVNIGLLAKDLNVHFINIDRYYDYCLVTNSTSFFSKHVTKRIHRAFFIMIKERFDLLFLWGVIAKRFEF